MGEKDFILTVMFLVTSLVISLALTFTYHRRKMLQLQMSAERQAPQSLAPQIARLEQDFLTLREGLTAHAMSLDENMKQLGSRMTAVESRTASGETAAQRVGG